MSDTTTVEATPVESEVRKELSKVVDEFAVGQQLLNRAAREIHLSIMDICNSKHSTFRAGLVRLGDLKCAIDDYLRLKVQP